MRNYKINSWKDCRNPDRVQSFILANGGHIRHGAGDHIVAEAPDGRSFVLYDKELSTGVACKLFKWLKYVGMLGIGLAILLTKGW